jgi:large subunit ribosomal protein L29
MPLVRMKEIRAMSTEERTKKLGELRAELSRLRTMISAGGAIENPTRVWELRKAIARLLTVENQKIAAGTETKPATAKAEPKKPKTVAAKKPKETNPE